MDGEELLASNHRNDDGGGSGVRPLTPAEKMVAAAAPVAAARPQQQHAPHPAPPANNLAVLRARARTHVEEAIQTIAPADKEAYLEAMVKAPEVVASETDPLPFIRVCDYNVWDAAKRIVFYWKERKELFGPERFFRPLNLTGNGALTQAEVLSLRAGFPVLLPDACREDQSTQQVVWCDRRQKLQTSTWQMRLRSAFYLIHLLAQDDRAQTVGVLLMILVVTPRVLDFEAALVRQSMHLAAHAFPIRWRIHLLNSLPKNQTKRYAIQDSVTAYLGHIMELYTTKDVEVHFEREPGQLFSELQAMGLKPEGIPESVGGTWSFGQFQQWCRERAIAERKQYRKSGQYSAGQAAGRVTSQDRKTSNVLYARRKRLRDKQELTMLNEEKDVLTREHDALQAEQLRLIGLLQAAKAVLETRAGASGDVDAILQSLVAVSDGPAATADETQTHPCKRLKTGEE